VKLLVIRHAVAEEREDFAATGKDDSLRPLTDAGRAKMERGARGLRRVLPSLDVIATSPFTRAAQTAKIVAAAYDGVDVEQVNALTPESPPRNFITSLRQHDAVDHVAAVGHEPHLGALVYWLLSGESVGGRIAMKKGAACLLELDPRSRAPKATLLWSLTPSILRRLAD
jgi:phosphohistidine phosphatase